MFLQIQIFGDKCDQIQLSVQSWGKKILQELKEQFIQKFEIICLHAVKCFCLWNVKGFVAFLWTTEAAVDLWKCKAATKFILKRII